jgi:hypothetical protein
MRSARPSGTANKGSPLALTRYYSPSTRVGREAAAGERAEVRPDAGDRQPARRRGSRRVPGTPEQRENARRAEEKIAGWERELAEMNKLLASLETQEAALRIRCSCRDSRAAMTDQTALSPGMVVDHLMSVSRAAGVSRTPRGLGRLVRQVPHR